MYIERELEKNFLEMSSFFKAVLVTGARQVGKSTMLKHLAQGQGRVIVTMDDDRDRELARRDPVLFFQTYKPPILIDEIQKAPELLERIKVMCDESDERGRFWLTGSQRRMLMQRSQESLAGRLGILKLYGLSQREKAGVLHPAHLDFSMKSLQERARLLPENDVLDVFEHIWRGGFADLVNANASRMERYYQSYVDTYLIADAVNDEGIRDIEAFKRVLRCCAALSGELLNYKTVADTCSINVATAKKWIGILQDMDVIYLLEPYYTNELQRLVKTPKLYFCDTGLCAYLTRWTTADSLRNGAAAGHFYENYVVMELVKNYEYSQTRSFLSFYRDQNAREIDVFVEENGKIHPIEIKMSANPDRRRVRKYRLLDTTSVKRSDGGIVCMYPRPFPIDTENSLIPSNLI